MLDQVPEGWSLEMSCRCRVTHKARGLLVASYGPQVTVRSLLKRWRCRTCGERPTAGQWVDNPGHGYPGGPVRRIVLLR
jgi:hypothetical protein